MEAIAHRRDAIDGDFGTGLYLTNEVFLYRVVGPLADGDDRAVDVEDCYSLDVVSVPVEHVLQRKLRVVVPDTGPAE